MGFFFVSFCLKVFATFSCYLYFGILMKKSFNTFCFFFFLVQSCFLVCPFCAARRIAAATFIFTHEVFSGMMSAAVDVLVQVVFVAIVVVHVDVFRFVALADDAPARLMLLLLLPMQFLCALMHFIMQNDRQHDNLKTFSFVIIVGVILYMLHSSFCSSVACSVLPCCIFA